MPIKDVFRRRRYQKERYQRAKEEATRLKEIRKLQRELKSVLPIVLSTFEAFKMQRPQATYKTYLEELKNFRRRQKPKKKNYPVEFQVNKFPLHTNDCVRFRSMFCGFLVRDPFFTNDHDLKCHDCNQWRIANKSLYKPIKLW